MAHQDSQQGQKWAQRIAVSNTTMEQKINALEKQYNSYYMEGYIESLVSTSYCLLQLAY